MRMQDIVGIAAFAVMLGTLVVGSIRGLRPAARARRGRERERRREVMGRLRQSTLRHPAAPARALIRVGFVLLGLAVLDMIARNGIEWDTGSPGFWLPLFFAGVGTLTIAMNAVPLALGLLDHAMRRTVHGTVVEKITDVYEAGDGEGSGDVTAHYLVIEGHGGLARRPYRVTGRVMSSVEVNDPVTFVVAPRSGYVYRVRIEPAD